MWLWKGGNRDGQPRGRDETELKGKELPEEIYTTGGKEATTTTVNVNNASPGHTSYSGELGGRELVGWRMRSSGLIVLYLSRPVDADGGGSGSNFSQSEEGVRRILHVRTPNFSHECPSWGHLTGMDIGYEGTERGWDLAASIIVEAAKPWTSR